MKIKLNSFNSSYLTNAFIRVLYRKFIILLRLRYRLRESLGEVNVLEYLISKIGGSWELPFWSRDFHVRNYSSCIWYLPNFVLLHVFLKCFTTISPNQRTLIKIRSDEIYLWLMRIEVVRDFNPSGIHTEQLLKKRLISFSVELCS